MKRWYFFLALCAAAAAQTGAPQGQADKPAEAGRGTAQNPGTGGRGPAQPPVPAPAGRGGRGTPGAASAPAAVPSPKDLKFPPLRAIPVPNIVTSTLPNGLKISLLEDRELPVVNGIVLVHAGNLLDPPERIGLAAATGALLRTGGTAVKTAEQVDNLLDSMAARIDSSTEDFYTRLTFGAAKENAEIVLGLLEELLTRPEFRQDKIDIVRALMRTAIAQRNDDAAGMARREFLGVIYGKDSPFGWIRQYATVDRITRNDLRAFHRRYFFPANVTLGLCGDFDAAQMKVAIEKLFAGWNPPPQPAPVFPQVRDRTAPGLFLAEKKDLAQTFFVIGHMGGRRNDKDAAALQVLAAILGTGTRGRLAGKAQAKTGAPHDIRTSWVAGYNHPGVFEIVGETRSISAVEVIQTIQAEIERIRTTEVAEEELSAARDALLGELVFTHDTRAKLLGAQMSLEFFGYPKDYLQQRQKAIEAVTRADVLRAAKDRIVPANLAIVVAANPQMMGEPLQKLGAVNRIDLAIPEARAESVETTDASLAEGRQLLQKAQVAAGGVEKLEAVKDYTQVAGYQVDPSVQGLGGAKVTETDRWIAPTTIRQETTLPAGRVAVYTDGKVGWISTPQGWGPLIGTQQKQVLGDLFRSWFRLLLSDRIEGRTVNAMDATSIQITDTSGQEVKVEFDAQTGLPRRVTYDTPQAIGAPLYTEDLLEDYREVGGIKLPFKITVSQGGRKFADSAITEYKLNSGLKPAELSRRQ